MTPRRRLLATASAACAAAALTACEAPAPIVTIVNSGRSVYSEANTYCFEDQSVEQGNCAVRATGSAVLEVVGALPVGIDVGQEVAESPWFIQVSSPDGSNALQSEDQTGHYFAFQVPPGLSKDGSQLLTVRSKDKAGAVTGEWRFTLVPRE